MALPRRIWETGGGMRDAHLAQSCYGGLKLRFVRRPMAAQGLRPPPPDWEGCFAALENWEKQW
jgi:hypothetical protein